MRGRQNERDIRYLHLGNSGIYTRELFRYLHRRGTAAGHLLLTRRLDVETTVGDEPYPGWVRVTHGRLKFLSEAIAYGRRAQKIVIHGLFEDLILALLAAAPQIRAKSTWVLWGCDLYGHLERPTSIRGALAHDLRRYVVSRIPQIVSPIAGDAELCRTHFGWAGHHLNVFSYPNTAVPPRSRAIDVPPRGTGQPLRILAGNSASLTNRIEDLLTRLALIDDGNMHVHSSLAYGDADVRGRAIELGYAKFGERFHPMEAMMPYDTYLEFLQTIDIAAFNHQHQEAVGNILTLLSFGKRVFLHRNTTTWAHLVDIGVEVSDAAHLHLEPLPEAIAERNATVLQEVYGRHRLDEGLRSLFAPIPEPKSDRAYSQQTARG
jgi:dTDP-N-acetylfucosamine:lipid II N-acetylfucosaminyltransferase